MKKFFKTICTALRLICLSSTLFCLQTMPAKTRAEQLQAFAHSICGNNDSALLKHLQSSKVQAQFAKACETQARTIKKCPSGSSDCRPACSPDEISTEGGCKKLDDCKSFATQNKLIGEGAGGDTVPELARETCERTVMHTLSTQLLGGLQRMETLALAQLNKDKKPDDLLGPISDEAQQKFKELHDSISGSLRWCKENAQSIFGSESSSEMRGLSNQELCMQTGLKLLSILPPNQLDTLVQDPSIFKGQLETYYKGKIKLDQESKRIRQELLNNRRSKQDQISELTTQIEQTQKTMPTLNNITAYSALDTDVLTGETTPEGLDPDIIEAMRKRFNQCKNKCHQIGDTSSEAIEGSGEEIPATFNKNCSCFKKQKRRCIADGGIGCDMKSMRHCQNNKQCVMTSANVPSETGIGSTADTRNCIATCKAKETDQETLKKHLIEKQTKQKNKLKWLQKQLSTIDMDLSRYKKEREGKVKEYNDSFIQTLKDSDKLGIPPGELKKTDPKLAAIVSNEAGNRLPDAVLCTTTPCPTATENEQTVPYGPYDNLSHLDDLGNCDMEVTSVADKGIEEVDICLDAARCKPQSTELRSDSIATQFKAMLQNVSCNALNQTMSSFSNVAARYATQGSTQDFNEQQCIFKDENEETPGGDTMESPTVSRMLPVHCCAPEKLRDSPSIRKGCCSPNEDEIDQEEWAPEFCPKIKEKKNTNKPAANKPAQAG